MCQVIICPKTGGEIIRDRIAERDEGGDIRFSRYTELRLHERAGALRKKGGTRKIPALLKANISSGEQVRRRAAHEIFHVGRRRLALDEDRIGHDGLVQRDRGLDAAHEVFAQRPVHALKRHLTG
jgi:hypothetical protein